MKRMAAVVGILALLGCRAGKPLVSATPAEKTTPGTIAGVVHDCTGGPLANRVVHAIREGSAQGYSATTDVTGGFSIPVPPGNYRLRVDLLEGRPW